MDAVLCVDGGARCLLRIDTSRPVGGASMDSPHDAVLQFLLGETASIKSDASSSVASTSTSSHSHGCGDSVCGDREVRAASMVRDEVVKTDCVGAEVAKQPLGVDPISETDSDGDGSETHHTTSDAPQYLPGGNEDKEEIQVQVKCRDARRTVGLKPEKPMQHPDLSSMNRSIVDANPIVQPEDEDASVRTPTSGLQMRRSTTPSRCHTPQSPSSSKPASTPPGEASNPLHELVQTLRSNSDLHFIVMVLVVLVGYCCAIAYRAVYPVHYPLPNVDALFKPWDVSNVSARFVSPSSDHETTGAVRIEWELVNFPIEALREHGPEPFEYRLLFDDRQIQFEMDYWATESDDVAVLNKTMHFRLRPRDIPEYGHHRLQLEVIFPVPGSDDKLHTLTDTTGFIFSPPPTAAPILRITSPEDNTEVDTPDVVVEYEAHNVHQLDVVLDYKWRLKKRRIADGNLMLRGLGEGGHTITTEAFDADGVLIATHTVHIHTQTKPALHRGSLEQAPLQ